MRLRDVTVKLARMLLPASLLVRHPSDADDLKSAHQAAERANRVVDRWEAATQMQRAIEWESGFWRRHPGNGGG